MARSQASKKCKYQYSNWNILNTFLFSNCRLLNFIFEIIKNFNNSSWMKEKFCSAWKEVPHCIFFIILNCSFQIPNQSISLENVRNKGFQEMKPYFFFNWINISQVLLLYFLANKKTGEGIWVQKSVVKYFVIF